ncbi:hypothetical protein BH11BAC5_BH11BAC5_42540 [soil metagenome]
MQIVPTQRKPNTSMAEIYFWTATIYKWMCLPENDFSKQLVVDYLKNYPAVKIARQQRFYQAN